MFHLAAIEKVLERERKIRRDPVGNRTQDLPITIWMLNIFSLSLSKAYIKLFLHT